MKSVIKITNHIINLLNNRKKEIIIFVSLVIMALFSWQIITIKVKMTDRFIIFDSVDKEQQILPIEKGIHQYFRTENSFAGIEILPVTPGKSVLSGTIKVLLTNKEKNVIYAEVTEDARKVVSWEYFPIWFENVIGENQKEVEYLLSVYVEGLAPDDELYLYGTKEGMAGECWVNEELSDFDLNLNLISNQMSTYQKVSILLIIISMISVMVAFILLFYTKIKIEKIYLCVAVTFSIIYITLFPLGMVPDEYMHTLTAYNYSNSIMGVGKSENGSILMRGDDNAYFFPTSLSRDIWTSAYRCFKLPLENEGLVDSGWFPLVATRYLYFFSSIGITIGRILRLSAGYTLLLGRIMNAGFFILCMYWAIKITPIAKPAFFVFSMFPMVLQQVNSYSYDSVIFAFTVLTIALNLKMICKFDQFSKFDYVLWFICSFLLGLCKGGAVLPLVVLMPCIAIKRNYAVTKKIYAILLAIIGIGAVFLLKNYILVPESTDTDIRNIVQWAETEGYTIRYLQNNPSHIGVVIMNSIYYMFDYWIETMCGSHMGWLHIEVPNFITYGFLVCLGIAGIRAENEHSYFGMGSRFLYFLIFAICGIGSIMAVFFSHTPITYNYILGVQGRYFLPSLLLIVFSFRSDKLCTTEVTYKLSMYISVFLEFMTVASVIWQNN